jgi:hypothetical protein
MANDDSGAQPSAGQGCPALKSICGKNGEAGPAEGERRDGDIAPTAEESAAIIRFLKERRAGGGRAYAVILTEMTGENWRGKAGELEEMLRAAVHR